MENKRKKIALFASNLTGRYRRNLSRAFNIAAEELNLDLVIFNTYGQIGSSNALNEDFESEIVNYINLDQFDGIVFDGEGYNVDGVSDKIENKLTKAKCAVVSISNYVDAFYNIDFDDAGGLRKMVEHFIDHHHFTKIGFMSGYLTHPDAQLRLNEFRCVMKEHGLPEDGVGMFEGDFWYNKGSEAACYFLSLPERPEAIVCANDYMAIVLINELRKRGVKVPEDIAVSGYDGTIEGQEFLPHLSSVTRERLDIARKSLKLLVDLADHGKEKTIIDLHVEPRPIFSQSCGCEPLDYQHVLEIVSRVHEEKRSINTGIFDSESSLLKLTKVNDVKEMEKVFDDNSINFGEYSSFFLMVHTDEDGIPSYDSNFSGPSGHFQPVIWIDKNKEYVDSSRKLDCSNLIPTSNSDRCHTYYFMSVHFAGKIFGYSLVEMKGIDIFDEFYNVWLLYLGITLNTLQNNDHITKLIRKLENLSIKDGLTGMLNRRGFDDKSRKAISGLHGRKLVCTIVIDMDGLKKINDVYGHYEGDRAIKTLADIITKCSDSGEIAGRAGGDEFYIFAIDYTENRLKRFIDHMKEMLNEYNQNNGREYQIDFSYGAYMIETDSYGQIEDFIKISDERMYSQKMTKPGRRK